MLNINLYTVFYFIKIFDILHFYFSSKFFIVKSINIFYSLKNYIFITIKYFFIESFFSKKEIQSYFSKNKNKTKKTVFEQTLISSLLLISNKSVVILLFHLKKLYLNKFSKIKKILAKSILRKSIFFHSISIYIFTLLVFSSNNNLMLCNYIKLEICSTKNHNGFLLFIKSLIFFTLVINKNKNYLKIIGFCILVKGRFNGNNRSKCKKMLAGVVGTQSVNNFIEYNKCFCFTKFGIFGIKI
jgi:hypothetical protein